MSNVKMTNNLDAANWLLESVPLLLERCRLQADLIPHTVIVVRSCTELQ